MVRVTNKSSLINIDHCLVALVDYLSSDKDITAAYLYGSYGTEMQTPLSDVDMAVLLSSHTRRHLDEVMKLEARVAEICGCDDVNILILNDAPVLIQFRVISTGRLFYERDRTAVCDFQEIVFKLYADFMPDYLQFCRDYDRSLREAYVHGR